MNKIAKSFGLVKIIKKLIKKVIIYKYNYFKKFFFNAFYIL